MSLYTAGWLLLKADRSGTTGALAACQILVIIWCVPQLFIGAVTTVEMKYVLYAVSYIGICLIGPAWLEFSFRYCGRRYGSGLRAALFGISALSYLMFLGNPALHLFYREFAMEQVVYGPMFYFHTAYTYLCVCCGMYVVGKELTRNMTPPPVVVLILLAAAVPLGFNLLYLTGTIRSGFDLTPPAFAVSSFLLLVAVFRYDFLDVRALTFEKLLSSVGEGVVLYDRHGRLTYCNHAAEKWLGVAAGQEFAALQERLRAAGLAVSVGCEDTEEPEREFPVLVLESGIRLRLRQYFNRDRRGQLLVGILVLTDVSEYYELLRQSRELDEFRGNLALEQERNRIAQEVHDTTGHTLTMVQSLLRLMRAGLAGTKEEQSLQLSYLDQAQELVSGGIRELRCAINEMRQEHRRMSVTESVRQLAGSVREIPVEAEFQGEDGERYTELSPVVYSCLREAITNCLKYAEASRMDVIVKFRERQLNLYIFDDGKGCGEIQENNGLRGIRERVQLAGGTVRVMTAPGEGFQMYLEFPIHAPAEANE